VTAGDDLQRVRVMQAATGETIEIQWMRRIPDPRDPTKLLTEILIERHTAPPTSVWDARATKETDD
jgi:hypothetical protein